MLNKLPCPTLAECTTLLQNLLAVKRPAQISEQLEQVILRRIRRYDERFKLGMAQRVRIWPLGKITNLDPDSIDALLDLYKNRLRQIRGSGRSTYEKIRLSNQDGLCAYCGDKEAGTLDHYLPQRGVYAYPEFAVSLINLIPCCHDCNQLKKSQVQSADAHQIFHPYYDDPPTAPWLKCTVEAFEPERDLIAVHFALTETLDRDVYTLLEKHCRTFKLLSRYEESAIRECNEGLKGIKKRLEELKTTSGVNPNSGGTATASAAQSQRLPPPCTATTGSGQQTREMPTGKQEGIADRDLLGASQAKNSNSVPKIKRLGLATGTAAAQTSLPNDDMESASVGDISKFLEVKRDNYGYKSNKENHYKFLFFSAVCAYHSSQSEGSLPPKNEDNPPHAGDRQASAVTEPGQSRNSSMETDGSKSPQHPCSLPTHKGQDSHLSGQGSDPGSEKTEPYRLGDEVLHTLVLFLKQKGYVTTADTHHCQVLDRAYYGGRGLELINERLADFGYEGQIEKMGDYNEYEGDIFYLLYDPERFPEERAFEMLQQLKAQYEALIEEFGLDEVMID
ncbi:MAG: hypothetical protein IJ228_06275 [Succinivibrio sp.]|nr:hypothetical protein [Succinivibrio sp.]